MSDIIVPFVIATMTIAAVATVPVVMVYVGLFLLQ
jgi:hypothetical protein